MPYYTALAEAGREAGLLVFGHDHAGHGESEGERVLVADMAEFTGPLAQHCRDKMEQVGQSSAILTSIFPENHYYGSTQYPILW